MVGLKRAVCFRYQTNNAREFHETLQYIYRYKWKVQQSSIQIICGGWYKCHDGEVTVM